MQSTSESFTRTSRKKNPLNSRFFDSSCDDTSSAESSGKGESVMAQNAMTSTREVKPKEAVIPSCSSRKNLNPPAIGVALSPEQKTSRKFLGATLQLCHKDCKETWPGKNSVSGVTPLAGSDEHTTKRSPVLTNVKILAMFILWVLCTAVLIEKKEKVPNMYQISIPSNETKSYLIPEKPEKELLSIYVEGAFLPEYYANLSSKHLKLWLELIDLRITADDNATPNKIISEAVSIPLVNEEIIDIVPVVALSKMMEMINVTEKTFQNHHLQIVLQTNVHCSFPVMLDYDLSPIDINNGVFYAALVLLLLYVLIIFEILHRTLAGLLAATISVATLAALDERPSIAELASWIDFETILLLFSMMVLVAIFSETGIFDYLAVFAYKVTNGRIWPLINTLSIFTAFLSCFLDNVTTALLMTPVTIRLCEVMSLNPIPVLMTMMIYSNLGGAITPVGDPPNVIVASHSDVQALGVNFHIFFVHMMVGIVLVAIVVHFQLRFIFRNHKLLRSEDPHDVADLKHEIAVWERAAASISSYSKDEDNVKDTLHKRVRRLLTELTARVTLERGPPNGNYKRNLAELKERYPIKNKALLFKSGCTLIFVTTVFFLHSVPDLNLSLGCTAFMGALLLLLLANDTNIEGVLARVEWSTLLFFASLFVLMEALTRLRLIEWIGQHTENIIQGVDKSYRLPVSILLILWISAGVSAFVDNIPLTTMMIRIVSSLSHNPQLELPLMPLVWALCYGACLGGLATLIGSSSNVVCAGVAEQHGYRFTFVQYSKVGLPVMFVSVLVVSGYLLVAHVVLEWNQ